MDCSYNDLVHLELPNTLKTLKCTGNIIKKTKLPDSLEELRYDDYIDL